MRIDILFVPGCPNVEPALARLRQILLAEGLVASVEKVEVRDSVAAEALRFPGSPTIRINGRDIASDEQVPTAPSLACRLYASGPDAGIPPLEMVRRAVLAARH